MSKTLSPSVLNGIDLDALRECIAQVDADPANGMTSWKVHSRWRGGTRSDHEVRGTRIGGEDIDRHFLLMTDEPFELCGSNEHANPQEYLMTALNACMMVGYAAVAGLMGIRLTKIEVQLEGDIDLRGFLGLDAHVKPGYDALRQTVRLAGDGTPEQFARLHETVKATSPNFFNLTTSIPTRSTLVLD